MKNIFQAGTEAMAGGKPVKPEQRAAAQYWKNRPEIGLKGNLEPMDLSGNRTEGVLKPARERYRFRCYNEIAMNDLNGEASGKESADSGFDAGETQEKYSRQVESAREFVKQWAKSGPALEELRLQQLQVLDDETARKMMLDLFGMWRPSDFDDLGAGLVEQQKIFAQLRRREHDGSIDL